MGETTTPTPTPVAWTQYAVEVCYRDGRRYLLGSYNGQVPECWAHPAVAELAARANRDRPEVAAAVVREVACGVTIGLPVAAGPVEAVADAVPALLPGLEAAAA